MTAQPELARKVVDLGTHTLTYIRIAPPRLPRLSAAVVPPPRALTAEEQAAEDAREAKPYVVLAVSGVVYVGSPTVTELTWWKGSRQYRAWANVNALHLTQLSQLETSTHRFAWFPMISEIPAEEVPDNPPPAGLSLFSPADTEPAYYFEGSEEDMAQEEETLLGLDHFLAYYQLHREQLAADYIKRVEEAAARAAELAENPPKPADTVIYFWKTPSAAP